MRILGIDPGYGITGFGLIDAQRGNTQLLSCGAITTPAGMDFSARLEIIYEDMRSLLREAKPDAVAIEDKESVGAATFANVLVVREGDENREDLKALAQALTSEAARAFMEATYNGGVVPTF